MARTLREQVVVVTGASSGVGRAIARAFGQAGCRVGLVARTREALGNAAREIEMAGGEALALPLDIADAPAVDRAADEVVARWGRIDTWVNDAMVSVFSPVREMTAEEYRRVTEVNYLGTVYGTLAALRHMRRVGEGTIIQIGSALVGVLYVLDEPSIGLHQRDNTKLIGTLQRLRDLGNTVLVVEHDEQTMRAADHLVRARHRRVYN